jgi:glutathione-specific gamma-glutamylcyclotransferase|eukprot:g867.t1
MDKFVESSILSSRSMADNSTSEATSARKEVLEIVAQFHTSQLERLVGTDVPTAIDSSGESVNGDKGSIGSTIHSFLGEQAANPPPTVFRRSAPVTKEYVPGTPLLIFGYASVVWKPDLPFDNQWWGFVDGYKRRFWQGSPDHRGSPRHPGRVATMLPGEVVDSLEGGNGISGPGKTWGVVYSVAAEEAIGVLKKMDFREKEGFEKIYLPVNCEDGIVREALVYSATELNESFLGPSSVEKMAYHMYSCSGPSGPNVDYLTKLHEALGPARLDDHICALQDHVTFLASKCQPIETEADIKGLGAGAVIVVYGKVGSFVKLEWPHLHYTANDGGGKDVRLHVDAHYIMRHDKGAVATVM